MQNKEIIMTLLINIESLIDGHVVERKNRG